MPFKSPFALPVARIFGIDQRSLALFRVATALVLLSDLLTRARDLNAFYTDAGILPRSAQIELYSGLPDLFSLHLMSGRSGVEWMLFGVAILAGLALLVGYHTRWATIVSWLLLVSLHNRNPMVVQGGDVLLRMMLFWAMFLPMGGYFALDAFLRRGVPDETRYEATAPLPDTKPQPETKASESQAMTKGRKPAFVASALTAQPWLSVGTLAILLQLCFMYWFAVALKTSPEWRGEGTALYYALSIDQMVRPLGSLMLPHADLLRFLTRSTVEIERWGPLLALLPFWRLRTFIVFVFIGLHVTMGLALTLGIFPVMAAVAWLLFLPGSAWDFLTARYRASRRGWKTAVEARYETLWARLDQMFPAVLQDRTRKVKAANRAKREYLLVQGVASFFLLYVFLWNLRGVDANYRGTLPVGMNWLGESTRLDQRWDMFAPFPLKDDGWFVVEAKLNDGKRVDLLRDGAPIDWKKPADLSETYPDALWQKYLLNLWPRSNSGHRSYYAAYLMRQWNDSHPQPERIKFMQIVYMEEDTLPNYHQSTPKKVPLWLSGPDK